MWHKEWAEPDIDLDDPVTELTFPLSSHLLKPSLTASVTEILGRSSSLSIPVHHSSEPSTSILSTGSVPPEEGQIFLPFMPSVDKFQTSTTAVTPSIEQPASCSSLSVETTDSSSEHCASIIEKAEQIVMKPVMSETTQQLTAKNYTSDNNSSSMDLTKNEAISSNMIPSEKHSDENECSLLGEKKSYSGDGLSLEKQLVTPSEGLSTEKQESTPEIGLSKEMQHVTPTEGLPVDKKEATKQGLSVEKQQEASSEGSSIEKQPGTAEVGLPEEVEHITTEVELPKEKIQDTKEELSVGKLQETLAEGKQQALSSQGEFCVEESKCSLLEEDNVKERKGRNDEKNQSGEQNETFDSITSNSLKENDVEESNNDSLNENNGIATCLNNTWKLDGEERVKNGASKEEETVDDFDIELGALNGGSVSDMNDFLSHQAFEHLVGKENSDLSSLDQYAPGNFSLISLQHSKSNLNILMANIFISLIYLSSIYNSIYRIGYWCLKCFYLLGL